MEEGALIHKTVWQHQHRRVSLNQWLEDNPLCTVQDASNYHGFDPDDAEPGVTTYIYRSVQKVFMPLDLWLRIHPGSNETDARKAGGVWFNGTDLCVFLGERVLRHHGPTSAIANCDWKDVPEKHVRKRKYSDSSLEVPLALRPQTSNHYDTVSL